MVLNYTSMTSRHLALSLIVLLVLTVAFGIFSQGSTQKSAHEIDTDAPRRNSPIRLLNTSSTLIISTYGHGLETIRPIVITQRSSGSGGGLRTANNARDSLSNSAPPRTTYLSTLLLCIRKRKRNRVGTVFQRRGTRLPITCYSGITTSCGMQTSRSWTGQGRRSSSSSTEPTRPRRSSRVVSGGRVIPKESQWCSTWMPTPAGFSASNGPFTDTTLVIIVV